MAQSDWHDFSSEASNIWNQNAAFWDDYMGSNGNHFHRLLVAPTTEKLLNVQPGQAVLDVACGNGNFSRRLAKLGAHVVAIDASEILILRAQTRTTQFTGRITYQVVDATDKAQLLALGPQRFNAAVCNMALMDIPAIVPLLESLAQLLNPGGRFVFSVTHPCFQAPGATKTVEEEDHQGQMVTRYAVKISSYITPDVSKGLAIIGQPVPQYYFHRPLSQLFEACFAAGFVLDALEEPVFDAQTDGRRPFSWANFKEIPSVLVGRMRLFTG